jgi:anti-anti-sigma factor
MSPLTSASSASQEPHVVLGKAHSLRLLLDRHGAEVTIAGQIDMAAAPDIDRLLASLDRLGAEIRVDLTRVSFLDTSGVEPLVEACRRRVALGLPPLLLTGTSPAARRLLDTIGLNGGGTVDVRAWDRLDEYPRSQSLPPGGRRRLSAPGPPPSPAAARGIDR